MRISRTALALLVAVGACQRGNPPSAPAATETMIDCAVGNAPFARACSIERHGDMAVVLTADGSFRRFRITGAGWTAADGADAVTTSDRDGLTTIANWRVRLPPK